jgi:hypothetical protein
MILDELLEFAKPLREPIRASGRLFAHEVETRLDVSARHLSAACLGMAMEPAWHTDDDRFRSVLPTDHGTVVMASQTLVFASCHAALDLSTSALLMWLGYPPPEGREWEVATLHRKRLKEEGIVLPPWARTWRDGQRGDNRAGVSTGFRHAQVHRIVRRDSTVRLGRLPTSDVRISANAEVEPTRSPGDISAEVIAFARENWERLWVALAADTAPPPGPHHSRLPGSRFSSLRSRLPRLTLHRR